jgi:nucleotide-binding universal stress UspA family protein
MSMDIVVGVDESEGAADALRWAVREAEARDATVTAVLVWGWLDQHPQDPTEPFDPHFDEAAALTRVESIVDRALDGAVPAGLRLQEVNELAGPGLVQAAADADLLVVGARGMGGFKGLLVGSVSQHCLHHAPCPVVLVKHQDDPSTTVERIVVGVDSSATARRALDWALDAARAHGARVEVVHAWHPAVVLPMDPYLITGIDAIETAAREVLDDVVDHADDRGLVAPVEAMLVMASAGKAVLDVAKGADLIVVGSRQQSAAGCLFLGSTSMQVTHHAECPVVVVPPPEARP